jgi:hypothetical protein
MSYFGVHALDAYVGLDANGNFVAAANGPLSPEQDALVAELAEQLTAPAAPPLEGPPIGRTAAELKASTPEAPDWIVPGLIAPGWTVKFAAREKMGKGTFVMYLIGKLERGEPTVISDEYTTAPLTTLIFTEEPEESIREKLDLFGVESALIIYGWELAHLSWTDKAAYLVRRALEEGHGLIFVDNVSRAAGVEDEAGLELGTAIGILSDAVRPHKLAVLADHHHKKGRANIRDKSRGGTNAGGVVEVNLDMEPVSIRNVLDRRRKLTAIGRIRATVWVRTIELTEDGTEYMEATADHAAAPQDLFTAMVGPAPTSVLEYDAKQLERLGEVTAKVYADKLNRSVETARKRLNALVEDGYAVKAEGEMTMSGRRETLWRWVPPVELSVTPEP